MQQSIGLHGSAEGLSHQPTIRLFAETFMQGMHMLRFHGEPSGGGMASKTGQQITATGEGLIHSKSDGPTHRSP